MARHGASIVRDAPDANDDAGVAERASATPASRAAVLVLFLASGAATLAYQVLWQRQLVVLFGADQHATAATLTVFFGGLAIGNALCARGARRLGDPLRAYALLELGIAITALLPGALAPTWHAALPVLGPLAAPESPFAILVKLSFTAPFLLPATVLMGATLPVLAEVLVRERRELASVASLLVGCNTLGAAAGALAAGFWLPYAIGLRATTRCAVALNVSVALLALLLHARFARRPKPVAGSSEPPLPEVPASRLPASALLLVAGASGFATLALEVLWTRMFALVLNNSASSFAAILVVLLVGLAIGALLSHAAGRLIRSAEAVLLSVLVAAGLAVAASPFVLSWQTGSFGYLRSSGGHADYVRSVLVLTAAVTLLPAALCGAVLPCTLRLLRHDEHSTAAIVGRVSAINTAGGIAGALAAGFALLPATGLWGGIRAVAALYLTVALVLASRAARGRAVVAASVALAAILTLLDPARLPIVALDVRKGESLHEVWQGSHGVVAVVARPNDLRIQVDGSYTLGGRSAQAYERTQADLPLLLARRPQSAFFIGLGTGITAAAALRHPLASLTAAELIPEVVVAARKYFGDDAGALFDDPRARVIVGDGRHVLLAEERRYDVIVSDLFVPWHAGSASLYSREHFATVRGRLNEGGTFALWLPLYQMSRREFSIVARTMADVFPQVTLWRGDFLTRQPIVALVGQETGATLDLRAVAAGMRGLGQHPDRSDESLVALAALLYGGNVTASAALFADAPIHTDDLPVLEMSAARTQADVQGHRAHWLVGDALAELYEDLAKATPPEADPYVAMLDDDQRRFVTAGLILYRSLVALAEGRTEDTGSLRGTFRDLVPYGTYELFRSRLSRADEFA